MNESTYRPKSILFLSLAGLSSAMLTIAGANAAGSIALRVAGGLGSNLFKLSYAGVVFGGSIASYFVLREGLRSVEKIVVFVCSCIAAHFASMFVAFLLFMIFHTKRLPGSPHLDIPLPAFFGAGFVGTFIVLIAALFLFGPSDAALRSIGKLLLRAAGGGVLAVIGWAAGPILGGALAWLACPAPD
jgi:hypothetical protein